ncbi:hypothetical protein D3C75_621840 [compost metagenome]
MKHRNGEAVDGQKRMIRLDQRLGHRIIADVAPVDDGGDGMAACPCFLRTADTAADSVVQALPFEGEHLFGDTRSVNCGNHRQQVPVAHGLHQGIAVMLEQKGDLRMGQGQPVNKIGNMTQFRLDGFHIFEPCRCIEEQLLDADVRPSACRRVLVGHKLASGHFNAASQPAVIRSRDAFHLGHRCDTGQRLAPEAQGPDVEQILAGENLAGGMALERPFQIIRTDAAAVIRNPDQSESAVLHGNVNPGASGIDGILHQLLHHGGRTLHNLSRRNLIGNVVIQYADNAHISSPQRSSAPDD